MRIQGEKQILFKSDIMHPSEISDAKISVPCAWQNALTPSCDPVILGLENRNEASLSFTPYLARNWNYLLELCKGVSLAIIFFLFFFALELVTLQRQCTQIVSKYSSRLYFRNISIFSSVFMRTI